LVEASLAQESELPGRLWSPNPLVSRFVGGIVPGLAIDLGCGTGRDAVYLASLGWNVVAIDLLPDAIVRAKKFSERTLGDQSRRIRWIEGDVKPFQFSEPVQLLVSFRFLEISALQRGMVRLSPKGLLLGEVFTPTNREKNGRPANPNLVMDAEQASLFLHGMQVLHLEEVWEEGSHFLRFAAVRPTPD
jgi:SAM-dependent methyltransferase